MRKLLPILLLLAFAPTAWADRISAEITFTNTPANGSNLVVNASTRSFITVVTVPASQIAVTNNIPNSVTNLFRHLLSSPFTSIQPVLTATNKITLHGANGLAMSVALNSDWGTVTYSTQTVSGVKIAVVVPGSDFASDVRQKMFSMLTTSLNDYATSPVVSGSVFAQALMGLTNNQTVAGAKILTNAANIWQDGLITNAPLRGLQMHYYPSNGGIYGFTSGLDPSTVLAVDASGYFGIYAVNAVMGEPLDTPLNIAPLPASILNMLSASNKFGGKSWDNSWTGTNSYVQITNSLIIGSALTNVQINGTYYGPITQFGTNLVKSADAAAARTLLGIIPSGLTSADFNPTQFRVDSAVVSLTNGVLVTNLVNSGTITSATLDTGQGANDLFDMDQNVLTTSTVTFGSAIITGGVTAGGTVQGASLQGTGLTTGRAVFATTGGVLVSGDTPRTLHVDTTTVGNVGTGTDDLMSYTLPANTLAANHDRLIIRSSGTYDDASSKDVFYSIDGSVIGGLSGVTATGRWSRTLEIIRTSGTAYAFSGVFADNVNRLEFGGSGTATFSGAIILKSTASATSDNDVTQTMLSVEFKPAP